MSISIRTALFLLASGGYGGVVAAGAAAGGHVVGVRGGGGSPAPGVALPAGGARLGVALLGRASAALLAGLVLSLGRISQMRWVNLIASAYIELFRNTPVLVQLIWFYYAFPVLTAKASPRVLPRHERSERDLAFTVLSVTVLSTVAMVLYPMLSGLFGFTPRDSGVFLGGTIHDVAQVVGAGFSIGPETGETATLVKLPSWSMLGVARFPRHPRRRLKARLCRSASARRLGCRVSVPGFRRWRRQPPARSGRVADGA
nr:putative sulfate exporter family transporter [Paracoccus mutanolyticus]